MQEHPPVPAPPPPFDQTASAPPPSDPPPPSEAAPVPSEAQPPAEQPQTPQPGTDAGDAAQQAQPPQQPPVDEHAAEAAEQLADAPLPTIPDLDTIAPTVKSVVLAGGVEEAVFARDLVIPTEEREKLVRSVSKALTGMDIPVGVDVASRADNLSTVGKLIDFFEEQHPDHPTQQSER